MVTSILRVVKSVLGNAQHRPDRRAKDLEGTTLCFAGGNAELRPERRAKDAAPRPPMLDGMPSASKIRAIFFALTSAPRMAQKSL
jgi:hypothetical protein